MRFARLMLATCLGALVACASYPDSQAGLSPSGHVNSQATGTNAAPFEDVQASWKQRLDQPYVYLEHRGSYTETGTLLPALHRELAAQGLEPSGAPFCLFYDDPALVPVAGLRSRACVPIAGPRSPRSPLAYDVLPSTTVAYAYASGSYADVPRMYPGIYRFMSHMNWVENGPIREVYLVAPTAAVRPQDLICEVQIPAAPRGRN